MHHIYNTEAIVLGGSAVGEADRACWFLTRELGLVMAHARSVREEKSKLRYTLQDFSLVQISLVRGRGGWRVTGAVLEKSFSESLKNIGMLQKMAKIFDLIKRFVPKEEKNDTLFGILRDSMMQFDEVILVAKILKELGYLRGERPVEERGREKLLIDINEAIAHADL